jgi:hypothetical protein
MSLIEGLSTKGSLSTGGQAMIGCQYKYMDRYYVMVGETFQGIVQEPLFLETTEAGKPLSRRPDRLDGWYLGVPTGRRLRVISAPPRDPFVLAVVLGIAAAVLMRKL